MEKFFFWSSLHSKFLAPPFKILRTLVIVHAAPTCHSCVTDVFFSVMAIASQIASALIFQKDRIKLSRRITQKNPHPLLHQRIRRKNLLFLLLFLMVLYHHNIHKSHFGQKLENVMAFVASQSQHVIKLSIALVELQFTFFLDNNQTNFRPKINQKNQ